MITDNVMRLMEERVPYAMALAAEVQVWKIQEDLSTPYPPASVPYTVPHLRTGYLRKGVRAEQEWEGSNIVVIISSSRANGPENVPEILEMGLEGIKPRPYMGPAMERIMSNDQYLRDVARFFAATTD